MAKPEKTSRGRRTGSNNRVANLSIPTSSAGSRKGAAAGTRKAKPKPAAKPAAKPQAGNHQSRFAGARDANLSRISKDPRFASPASADAPPAPPAPVLRSPAIGAPVHAKPQDFGAAAVTQPSAFAPQVGQAPRPNAPQPAMSPQYGGNDEPGRMGQNENGYQMPQQPQAPAAGGPDANGIDMERRRAFLDADDSLSGLKAVKDLLNRRKLSISVEN
jgi:hypothetical protein